MTQDCGGFHEPASRYRQRHHRNSKQPFGGTDGEPTQGDLGAKGLTLFALVDHSGEASRVGLTMPPTKLLIFGNPTAGTPLMLASPSTAIDLPLKLLVREDPEQKVWISYNSPDYLQQRHSFPQELLPNVAGVEKLAAAAAK